MGLLSKIFGGSSSFGPLQIRVIKKDVEDITGFIVQCKGTIPVYSRTNIGFIVSLMCKDEDGKLNPVLSFIGEAQEEKTSAYQHIHEIGVVDGPGGYDDWGAIAPIIPDLIQSAYGGLQKIGVVVRLVDMHDPPSILLGFSDTSDCIWTESEDFSYDFKTKGYKEEEEDKEEARALSVKLGMAVAMADGELDDSEGKTLNKWIKKIISPYSEDKQESLKKIYNKALKESYKLAESGKLNLTAICKQMNKVAETPQKHEALELAHEVMAADGVLDKSETKMINKIAALLEIDTTELENIRDKQLVSFKPKSSDDDDNDGAGGGIDDVESLLGIDPTWSNKKILAHLGKEFAKWNGRMNSLPEGKERENAQKMLDRIAEIRKKYAE
jgi:uncharacterized tellurite resistance protein B-like protein